MESHDGDTRDARINDILLFGLITAPFAALFITGWWMWAIVPPVMAAVATLYKRDFARFCHGFFWVIFLIVILARLPWPAGFLLPLAIYFIVITQRADIRKEAGWLKAGSFNGKTLLVMIPSIIVSSGALVAWVVLYHPDLSDLTSMVPVGSPWLLLVAGFLFSVFNAAWEEFILKGIMWSGLEKIFTQVAEVNIIQSVFFGLIHYRGFPRGVEGVAMASAYGFFIGLIRHYSGGMLAPVVTHFFADLTIFIILAVLAAR